MVYLRFRAWMTRAAVLLFSGLLTAAQAALFLTPVSAPDRETSWRYMASEAVDDVTPRPIYGNAAARFTLTEYGDLECPYCASSFESIRHWINSRTDVRWQWRHFLLASHDPHSRQAARRLECIRETQGDGAFWRAVAQHYGRYAGAAPTHHRASSPSLQECLTSARPDAALQADAEEAARLRITATPTFLLQDHKTGQRLMLRGAVNDTLLLSAIDAILASPTSHSSR